MAKLPIFRKWVGSGGDVNHYLVFLEIKVGGMKTTSPFKLNASWLKDEAFFAIFQESWTLYNPVYGVSAVSQFAKISQRSREQPYNGRWLKGKGTNSN